MSDEELIARLRSLDTWAETADVPDLAADRIKQLVAEYDEAVECNEEFFVYSQILKERCGAQQTEITALRAKVARLEGQIKDWEARIDDCEWSANSSLTEGIRAEMRAALTDGAADGGKHE